MIVLLRTEIFLLITCLKHVHVHCTYKSIHFSDHKHTKVNDSKILKAIQKVDSMTLQLLNKRQILV